MYFVYFRADAVQKEPLKVVVSTNVDGQIVCINHDLVVRNLAEPANPVAMSNGQYFLLIFSVSLILYQVGRFRYLIKVLI